MIIRKLALAACAAALTTSPAWAAPGDAPRGGGQNQQHARSHRCTPHRVGYVAAGTLTSHTLALDVVAAAARADKPTYSGDVTIDVTRANRHARADKGTTKTYTLDHARVLLALADQNADGRVDLADVVPGSRVRVIGKVTKLRRGCDQTGFVSQLTVGKLIVHAPKATD